MYFSNLCQFKLNRIDCPTSRPQYKTYDSHTLTLAFVVSSAYKHNSSLLSKRTSKNHQSLTEQ